MARKKLPSKEIMMKRYQEAEKLPVGKEFECPVCGTKTIKNVHQRRFCKNKQRGKSSCKDKYWNIVDEKRKNRAIDYNPNKSKVTTQNNLIRSDLGKRLDFLSEIADTEHDGIMCGGTFEKCEFCGEEYTDCRCEYDY